ASTQIFTARFWPPTRRTSPTPLLRSSWTLATLSASSVSSRTLRSADSAIVSTGAASLSCLVTMGGSVPGGRLRSTVCTRARTSAAATSMSRDRSKVAITNDTPVLLIERSSRMPSTVLTALSICSVISVSTSSGAPPGSVVRTETIGTSTEGKRSTPSEARAAAPTTTSARISMAAKIGRRMQISASFCMSVAREQRWRRARLGEPHRLALLQRAGRAHHELARREAAHDLDAISRGVTERDRRFHGLALLHEQHLVETSKADHGAARNGRHLAHADADARAHEVPRPQVAGIGDVGFDQQAATVRL